MDQTVDGRVCLRNVTWQCAAFLAVQVQTLKNPAQWNPDLLFPCGCSSVKCIVWHATDMTYREWLGSRHNEHNQWDATPLLWQHTVDQGVYVLCDKCM